MNNDKMRRMYDEIPEGMISHVGITQGEFSCRNCDYYGLYEGQNFKTFDRYVQHFFSYHLHKSDLHWNKSCSACGKKENDNEPLTLHYQKCPGWQEILIQLQNMGYKMCFEHSFITRNSNEFKKHMQKTLI